MTSNEELKKPLIPQWFWWVLAAIFLTWLTWSWILCLFDFPKLKTSNEVGDSYGVLNTLFSGLAFLGVLLGIFIQGREFRSQLREMAETADEMRKQTLLSDGQLKALATQTALLELQYKQSILKSELEALPFFEFRLLVEDLDSFNDGKIPLIFDFMNHGAQVFELRMAFLDLDLPIGSLPALQRIKNTVQYDVMILAKKEPISVRISYFTTTGKPRSEELSVNLIVFDNQTGQSNMAGNPGLSNRAKMIESIKVELGITDYPNLSNAVQGPPEL